jgi:hypothetical protein
MWIVRFLSGALAGQTFPLEKASVVVGRAPNCDIKVPSSSVSKEHVQIEVLDDKVLITDMNSRNGTFLNGVQIRSSKARSGDRIAIHDIIFEIQKVQNQQPHPGYPGYAPQPSYHGNAAYQQNPQAQYLPPPQMQQSAAPEPSRAELADRIPALVARFHEYMDDVAMPGVYKLVEMFEFKWVLGAFMAAFILIVTSLSTIPLLHILKSSVEKESQQHALTIATTLARVNRPALMQGMDTAVSVEIATTRPGVKKAFIISNIDGNVIAPATMAGSVPDLPFVHQARKGNHESVMQIDDNTIAAMVPIEFFNADTGTQAITAWAVVFYDMSAMAVDSGQIISQFVTTLCMSLALGFVLFFFLYKIVENPIHSLNKQLDTALKNGQDTVTVSYKFPALQTLASNVSSALTRAQSVGGNSNSGAIEHDRNREVANIIELMGFAAVGIYAHDLSIAAANQGFESRTNLSAAQLQGMTVNDLADQALKLSVKDLISRVDQNPAELASNDLEFSGNQYQVVAIGVYGTAKVAYYVVVLLPQGEGG